MNITCKYVIFLWLPVKEITDWMLDHADSGLVSRMDLGKSRCADGDHHFLMG